MSKKSWRVLERVEGRKVSKNYVSCPLINESADDIIAAERTIQQFQADDAGNHSYREFLAFFHQAERLTCHHVTIGAYFTYGWMPPKLATFKVANLEGIVDIMNMAKQGTAPTDHQLRLLMDSINNSLVGPSKLLHFINPVRFAIWDSRVFQFIERSRANQNDMNSVQNYRD